MVKSQIIQEQCLIKEDYEKAEEILKWAYGISENSGK